MKMYDCLLAEGFIGKLKVKNRVLMAPVCTNFAGPDGGVTDAMIGYYAERARGGVGLVIVENANVDFPLGVNGTVQLRIDEDRFIPGLALLREAMYDADPTCRVALQINHAGAQTFSRRTGGRVAGPSNIPTRLNGEIPRPLTGQEIAGLVEKFALAAQRAKKAGFDAVELHGGFGYLLAQFLSPYFNRRDDEYGGSTENRLRFPVMIIRRIREILGAHFPILFRMNGDEFLEGGLTLAESKIYAKILEKESVDLLHITGGCGLTPERHIEPMSYPQADKVYLAGEIKQEVSIPVAAVGVLREPQVADDLLSKGIADFVALGRTLIADPYWANKASLGREINHCISCNVCAGRRLVYDIPIRCSVNPLVGQERMEAVRRTEKFGHRKVLIIGGGPAGLRAALETSKDGHEVILLERDNVLGGRALLASVPPYKDKVTWLVNDLVRELKNQRVDIRIGVTADMGLIQEIDPDVIIVASGSDSTLPQLSGYLQADAMMLAEDIFKNAYQVSGKKVAVIGGGSVGCECAEYLAEQGNSATVFELSNDIALDLDPISRGDLLQRLAASNIEIKTQHCVQDVSDGTVVCQCPTGEESRTFDLIAVATGSRVRSPLLKELGEYGEKYDVHIIGDCFKPGRFVDAIRQAYITARKIRNK